MLEDLVHVDTVFGRCLKERETVLLSECLSPLSLNYSICPIALVCNQHLSHVRVCVLVDLLKPIMDVVESLLVGAIVHKDNPHSPFVIGLSDRAESLLPCSVPDL